MNWYLLWNYPIFSKAEVYDITEVLSGFPAGVVEKARLKSGVACVTEAHNGVILVN